MAVSIFEVGYPVGRLVPVTLSSCGEVNSAVSAYVTAAHKQLGPVILTTLTLTALPQTVVNGTEYVGTKLWTFPSGLVVHFDVEASLTQKTTSDLATTINASSTGAVAVGSAAASAVALTSTMANFLPSFAFVSSATINVAGTTVTNQLDANGDLTEMFKLDGNTTATPVYLNSAFATTTDVDGDGTQTWTGTILIKWLYYSGNQIL
jgi:hypothetical protein